MTARTLKRELKSTGNALEANEWERKVTPLLHDKYPGDGGIRTITRFGDLPIIKTFMGLEHFLNTGPLGLAISNHYSSYSFHSISAKLGDRYPGNGGTLPVTVHRDLPNN